MRVFITGATGFIGSAIVTDLIQNGHRVLALARSDDAAASLGVAGAEVHRGDLKDLASLRAGAALSDGVIHAAFDHDFSRFAENCDVDRQAIEAIGQALEGSDRPLIVTSGLPLAPGRLATENDVPPQGSGGSPRASEQAALALLGRGVRVSVVRMSQAHDQTRHGLASYLITLAREKGISAYIGSGLNRWAAVHRQDTGSVYRLALETNVAGARYHAVAEEGLSVGEMAEVIGRHLNLPVVSLSPAEAPAHFGWLAFPAGMDAPASSALTRQRLRWKPMQNAGFMADLESSTAWQA